VLSTWDDGDNFYYIQITLLSDIKRFVFSVVSSLSHSHVVAYMMVIGNLHGC